MKRRFTAALSALLLCPTLLLTSCDKVSESKVKKDPAGLAVQAVSLDFEKNETVGALENVLKKDTFHIYVEAELDRQTYAADLYSDGTNVALTVSDGLPIGEASLYFNKKEAIVQIEDILETPVGIRYEDLTRDKILNSVLADEVGFDEDDFDDETWEAIEKLRDALKKNGVSTKEIEKTRKKIGDSWKKIISDTKPEITTEKLELQDGVVPAVLTTFELDGDLAADLTDALFDGLQEADILPEDVLDTYRDATDNIADSFDSTFDSLELTVGIAKKSGKMVYAELNADVRSYDYTITLDLGKDPEKSEEYLLTAEGDGEEIEIKYTRKSDKNDISRKVKCYHNGDVQFEAKLDWNQKDGDFKLKMSDSWSDISVTGSLIIDKKKIEFSLDDDTGAGIPAVKLLIETDAKLPTVPKYTSVLDLTEDEINDAYESCANILYGGYGDYDFDDDWDDYDYDDYDYDDYDYDDYDWDDDDWYDYD